LASCLALGAVLPALSADNDKPTKPAGEPSTVDVAVLCQGVGVKGIRVTVAPDVGGEAEMWTSARSEAVGSARTDSTGHSVFKDIPPGRYIATSNCSLPGNWIAGNYATRFELLSGRPAHIILTVRRGGMIIGTATQTDGGPPPAGCNVKAESPDALLSGCATMTASLVDSASGAFTVTKTPMNALTMLKATAPLGEGKLGVWKNFRFTSPDTERVTVTFPRFKREQLGTAVIAVRMPNGKNVEKGHIELLHIQPDSTWRYEITLPGGGADSLTTFTNLPAGEYQVHPTADASVKEWWSAPFTTVVVPPGGKVRHNVTARPRT